MKYYQNFKNIAIASIAAFVLLCSVSCRKNFLERQPLDAISDETVWTDVPLVEAFVNEVYSDLRSGWSSYSGISVSSDESYARERDGAHLIQRGELTPSNMGFVNWPWEDYYSMITSCNIFFDHVKGEAEEELKEQDEERVDRMIGEMKFLRAYSYLRLTAFFGGVPLITTPFKLDDDFMVKRNSYDEVMSFIVKELDEAAALLPVSYSSDNLGRITKGAALALKSRALLYAASPLHNPTNDKAKYQLAADAAKAVVDLGVYSLYPDYISAFTVPFNAEMIWVKVENNAISRDEHIERDFYPNGSGGYAVTVPTQNQIDAYEMSNGLLPKDDPAYDPQNPYVNRDPRFYQTILYNGAPWKGRKIETFLPGGIDSNQGNEGWNASYTGYYTKKYVDESINGPSGSNSSSPNWPYIRYAEVLLNYAEAAYGLGDEDLAREYLNKVRSRPSVMMPDVTASGPALYERIKNERRVELYLEEHRFFDMRRWKMAVPANSHIMKMDATKNGSGKITYAVTPLMEFALPEKMFLCPIPQNEIDKNGDLEQNPGY